MDKQDIGRRGEDLAAKFLEKCGYRIRERNYWKKFGELDIVAEKSGILHFIEVKTVSREHLPSGAADAYEPEDNIHPWKRRRLARVVEIYLSDKKIGEETDWQVDALAIYVDKEGNGLKYDLLEDVCL